MDGSGTLWASTPVDKQPQHRYGHPEVSSSDDGAEEPSEPWEWMVAVACLAGLG